MGFRLRSRRARGAVEPVEPVRDADALAPHLEDAAHFPGGHSPAILQPTSEAQIAHALITCRAVLPIGAQSSLTGGATPMGEVLLSTARLTRIERIASDRVHVQAGVPLHELETALTRAGKYYPPAPTYPGAFVGGTVSTNAAGAATFKYGTTRRWVQALTVVLPSGDVLDVERGETHAHLDGYFELDLADRCIRVPVPRYVMPAVPKLSAGYFAEPGMDLIDLFIGAEGTLGVITEVSLRILPVLPTFAMALVPFDERGAAMSCVHRLRAAAIDTWQRRDASGIDVSAIEHMDARCLALLREDGVDRLNAVSWPEGAAMILLVTLELPSHMTPERAFEDIGRANGSSAPDSPLGRFCAILAEHAPPERVQLAVPGDRRRATEFLNVREAVPAAVNRRVGRARQQVDARIEKTAADVIVPLDRFDELLDFLDAELIGRALDGAVWGHVSDGNVHPNVLPRSFADVESGRQAILALGREAIRIGGAPLAEHGVGRNQVKQQLLAELYGHTGIEDMRRVKAAIDPQWKLAPGVIFSV